MGITLTFETEEPIREELARIAKAMRRDLSSVINEAIDNHLELYRWQIQEIEKGIADSDAGRTYSTEQVREMLAKRHRGNG